MIADFVVFFMIFFCLNGFFSVLKNTVAHGEAVKNSIKKVFFSNIVSIFVAYAAILFMYVISSLKPDSFSALGAYFI